MTIPPPTLLVNFYRTEAGTEPVRDWLRDLPHSDRKIIGEEIKTVQIGWPLGMPLVRKMDADLWEIRISLPGRIARVLFTIEDKQMVLLHGFIKKSQATPKDDLKTARKRQKQIRSEP
ncbi:MAG: type II toxin-antitoxin system RelE/ParE family toxin [Pseudomonadota bacterium]